MRLIRKEYVLLVIASVIATLVVSTGCRTQRSIPKLADLAWWKKNDVRITSTPQPPASHFNPEPSAEMQASSTVDRDRQRELADSAAIIDEQLTQTQIENRQSSSPIRKPYSLESGEGQVANNNSFEATGAGDLKTKLPDWNNSSPMDASRLSNVQRGFEDSLQKSNAGLNSNTMASASTQSSSDFASSWRNDFALPAKKSPQGIDESIDKTIEAAADALSQEDRNVADSVSGFEARAKNAFDGKTTSLAQSANDFSRNTIAPPSNALQPLQRNLQDWQNEPKTANQASTLLQGFQPATNQFESNSSTNPVDELQVLENRPPTRVAQAQPLSPQFSSNSGLPNNSLRSGTGRTSEPPENSAMPSKGNAYPSTPHGNYAPRNHFSQLDQNALNSAYDTQASFDSSVTENSAANAAGPGENPQKSFQHSPPESLFVPESIRRGSGSFAPGSINPLIPDSPR